jgi:hypothetical protein
MAVLAERLPSSKLTEIRDFYDEHGWVSVASLLPVAMLDAVVADIESILNPNGEFASVDAAIAHLDQTDQPRLYELHMGANLLASLKRITVHFGEFLCELNQKSLPVIEIYMGFLLGLPRDTRLAYDFHQESNFMKGFDEISNFHFPLRHASTAENGTMSVLDRSHKLGTLPFRKSRASHNSFTDLVPVDIDGIMATHEELHCYLEPGDVTIFHKDCIHRSNFNASDSCRLVGVSRLTQQYNYAFQRQTSDEL